MNQELRKKVLDEIARSKHHGLTSIEIDGLIDISPEERYEIVKNLRDEGLIYFSFHSGGVNRLLEYMTQSEKQESLEWKAT